MTETQLSDPATAEQNKAWDSREFDVNATSNGGVVASNKQGKTGKGRSARLAIEALFKNAKSS